MTMAPRTPVLAAKLTAPEPPPNLVARRRPRQILDQGCTVTAVIAPAGYGKTAAVRDWLGSGAVPHRLAWVSLDALDQDPMSFWHRVVAGLSLAAADLGPEPAQVLIERGADDPAFLGVLLHRLATVPAVVLVLDDLHVVRNQLALDHLALLSDRSSHRLRLIVISRTEPALPLARWRVEGRLAEIRTPELQFDLDEAAKLLDGLEHLHLTSAGWSPTYRCWNDSTSTSPPP